MTNLLTIQYLKEKNIEIEIEDYLYFTGANLELKKLIINCLKRFSLRKSLSEVEENIFGEQGIQIYYNDRLLKPKDVSILYYNSYESILNEFSIKKGTLLYEELLSFGDDLEVGIQMEKINNEILNLETIILNELRKKSEKYFYHFKELLFHDLVNRYLEIHYFQKENEIPIEYVNSVSIINKFIELINYYINQTGNRVWLILDQPSHFLKKDVLDRLFKNLLSVAEDSRLLHLFIFNNSQINFNFPIDIEKTVLLFEDYQQLPDFEVFRGSIARNYPTELDISDDELRANFFKISHLIGEDIDSYYSIDPKDMVLLTILKELLGDKSSIETSFDDLNSLERNFLNDKI